MAAGNMVFYILLVKTNGFWGVLGKWNFIGPLFKSYLVTSFLLMLEHIGSSGYVDFFADDGWSWATKLLRDGADASGHKSRFGPGGIYEPIRNICKEWAIIDIRCPGIAIKTLLPKNL